MTLSYHPLTKAPNLIYFAIMEYMRTITEQHNKGLFWENPETIKYNIERELDIVLGDSPAFRKALTVTAPKPDPTTPRLQYVNLIWENSEKVIVLAQITCVLPEGGVS